jgi:hypothetical protein
MYRTGPWLRGAPHASCSSIAVAAAMVKLGLVWAVGLAVAATSCAMASEWGPPPSMEATS